MAFSTRRGRPPRQRADAHDRGTPELQQKRALGITVEPVDICLERNLISADQHWCSLHLRWLYTLRYGAPVVTTRYADKASQHSLPPPSADWRAEREQEYTTAIALLQRAKRYEPVMRLSVFNERPAFLSPALMRRAWTEPAMAHQLNRAHTTLLEGLNVLVCEWRCARNNERNVKPL